MSHPKIYADFQNADSAGRLRLNCIGTMEDLSRQSIELREGAVLTLYAEDVDENDQLGILQVEGVVSYSQEEQCWVAAIDWDGIRHATDFNVSLDHGKRQPSPIKASESRGRRHSDPVDTPHDSRRAFRHIAEWSARC